MGSSQPADEPDEPLRLLGSQEFLRIESNESVENRRQAGTAEESLRPAPVDSRRNTTPAANGVGGGVEDSESRRVELTESRRNDEVDEANESRRNDDGNAEG